MSCKYNNSMHTIIPEEDNTAYFENDAEDYLIEQYLAEEKIEETLLKEASEEISLEEKMLARAHNVFILDDDEMVEFLKCMGVDL